MSNFLEFIEEDIQSKKTLFSTMPTNTKPNKRKFDEKIAAVSEKYTGYKDAVKKYIDIKSKSFEIKREIESEDEIRNNINDLETVRFVLNPSNTYIEKMGFDSLLFQISNYYEFKFSSLNDILNEFFDKFELAGVYLTSADFDYTCYVNEYMGSFLEVRNKKADNYSKVSEVFEKIYWVNPEIIEHIELNFRKLIRKYGKKFDEYILKLQSNVLKENRLANYDGCLERLNTAYEKLNNAKKENICDIVDLAKSGKIDINQYFEDSKIRNTTYSSLTIDSLNVYDSKTMDKFYGVLEKLKVNLEEYQNYMRFVPLFEDFKNEYQSKLEKPTDKNEFGKDGKSKELRSLEAKISEKEANLEKNNKKILGGKVRFFESLNNTALKRIKLDSIKQAKELYALYKELDKKYFEDKILSMLNNTFTVAELLHLYYSFDYFKKSAIKKVFNMTTYEEIIKYSDSFDLFAMNLTNVIVNGIPIFDENNVARVISNKYRLSNINLTETELKSGDLASLLEKIQLMLRINAIEKSSLSVDKIWFITQVAKINEKN